MELGAWTGETPVLQCVHRRSGPDAPVRELQTVTKTNHVILKDHTSHASQLDRPRLQGVASSHHKALCPRSHLPPNPIGAMIMKPSVLVVLPRVPCVPVGGQYTRPPSSATARSVEIASHEMPRQGLEVDPCDCVPGAVHLPVDNRLQGRPRGIGKEPGRHLNLTSQLGRSKLPLLKILNLLEGKVKIEMARLAQSDVSRSTWCLCTCPESATAQGGLQRQEPGDKNEGPEKTLSRGRQIFWDYSSS